MWPRTGLGLDHITITINLFTQALGTIEGLTGQAQELARGGVDDVELYLDCGPEPLTWNAERTGWGGDRHGSAGREWRLKTPWPEHITRTNWDPSISRARGGHARRDHGVPGKNLPAPPAGQIEAWRSQGCLCPLYPRKRICASCLGMSVCAISGHPPI